MRAMRRGTKEMDIIMSRFAGAELEGLDAAGLDTFEALLSENDQDLYQWVTGQARPPARFDAMVSRIAEVSARRG
ncbi:succinate dehydrogenase assembly factor 2 [Roseovarius salinarum]|uniref:succinate dehydrogenase assembly factor 2 n=1 Tax=Roseovarius salinarum TaxID=1981892 RepID=UPI001E3E233A|nr:succinate dehydrogenase assembly factor 2 [Roseovarius salinarum]